MKMWLLVTLIIVAVCDGGEIPDESKYSLPFYTEIDDYDQCMSKQNAFYCFGKFSIISNGTELEYYNFLKNHSEKLHNLDRTVFHRGYCVSSRCPHHTNTVDDFQKCVQDSHPELNTTLHTLYSCDKEKSGGKLDAMSWCYLWLVLTLAIMNIIGTLYDLNRKGDSKIESNFWTSWSVRSNWQQLVEPFGNDPDTAALAPIQGVRVFLMMLVIIFHIFASYFAAFINNPSYVEKVLINPNRVWVLKICPIVQVFFMLSIFLNTYNYLQHSKKLDLGSLPKQIMKRYIRIAPVHLLVLGFNATLWPHMSYGPLWSAKVYFEREMCRKRFWYHVFNINNFVEPFQYCIPQTWSLAVDIQLQIVSLVLTIYLTKYNERLKIKILAICLVFSCLFITILAYINSWKPMIFQATGKSVVNLGLDLDSFATHYYFSSYGSLPACFAGLIMAEVYLKWKRDGSKLADFQCLSYLCRYSFLLLLVWIAAGQYTLELESRLLLAVYLGLERPVFSGLACLWIFGLITGGESSVQRFLSWRGWLPLGRLSLSVLVVHWLVILTHLTYDSQPYFLSHKSFLMDILSICSCSYILAVPVTLLVELPFINMYHHFSKKKLIVKTHEKNHKRDENKKNIIDKKES